MVSLALIFCSVKMVSFAWSQSSVKLSLGLGYDNISEKYFLVHYDTLAVPSESLEVLRKTTDETEEQKALFRLELNKDLGAASRLLISNRFSLSNVYLRDILRIEWERGWFSLSNESELKTIQDTSQVTYQTDYFINDFDVKLKANLSPATNLKLKNSLEYAEYKEKSPYTYDYYLNRTSLDLDRDVAEGGFLHLGYQFSIREVPDSSIMDYDRHFFDVSFDKYFGWQTLLQMENELDRKTFSKPEKQDDFWENRFSLNLSRRIGERTELGFHNTIDLLGYDAEDEINFSYVEYELSAGLEYEPEQGLEIGAGPEWISFFSMQSDYRDYNYRQLTLAAWLDLMRSVSLWLSAEDKFGRRDYPSDENPFYTDYLLNQFSLLLNAEVHSHLGFSLMLSVDSEWHDSQGDDLTVFLISSELTYSF